MNARARLDLFARPKRRRLAVPLRQSAIITLYLFINLYCPPLHADEDPSTIVVPYSSSASRTIGDAVNIAFPYAPLGRCVTYDAADVVWDTAGAISSNGQVRIASAEESNKRTTELSLGFQTSEKIKTGIFDANSTFDIDTSVNAFRSDESKTITVEFDASADFGRHIIRDYKIDPHAPSPSADLLTFRQRCGTHFIRGERRASSLTILIRITSSSQAGKDALNATLSQTLGGGISLSVLSGQAALSIRTAYKSVIDYARRSGAVSVDYRALGGPGIKAAGEAAKLRDASDLTAMGDIVSNVASLFDQNNSGVSGYVLQSDTALAAPEATFDLARIQQIGHLTGYLITTTEATHRYDDLNSQDPKVFSAYFQTYADTANAIRSEIVEKIKACAAGGDCTLQIEKSLRGLIFLEDMFENVTVSLSCQYQKASDVHPVVITPLDDPMVLESISINVEGLSHAPDLIDFTATHVAQLGVDHVIKDVSDRFSGFSLSTANSKGEKRVFGTIYSENIEPGSQLSYDNGTRRFTINNAELQLRRERVLGSIFAVYAPGPQGYKISYDTGYPPRNGCPVTK